MIILFLSILTSCSLTLIFKLFQKYEVENFLAIVVNYITAAILCYTISNEKIDIIILLKQEWFPSALVIGLLFISLFNLVAFSAQRVGIAITSVATKISLCIPVLFSYYYFDDTFNTFKIIGIILALLSIYFTARKKGQQHFKSSIYILVPLILFLSSGCLDILFVYSMKTFELVSKGLELTFSATLYAVAASVGTPILLFKLFSGQRIKRQTLFGGLGLGLMNVFSIVLFLKCLDKFPESSFVFPIHNMSIVVLSALAASLLFNEKLSKTNLIGIVIALVSIFLISSS